MFFSCCSPISSEIQLARGVFLHPRRDANPAGFGQCFKPGGHVHPIAENIAILDHDIPDIQADAEFNALVLRHRRVSAGHAGLDLAGALECITTLPNSMSSPSPI